MLRHLLLLAALLCVKQTVIPRMSSVSVAANAAAVPGLVRAPGDVALAEAAREMSRRTDDPDLAAALAELADGQSSDDFERVDILMAQVPADEHALNTLWRAVVRRHAEATAASM